MAWFEFGPSTRSLRSVDGRASGLDGGFHYTYSGCVRLGRASNRYANDVVAKSALIGARRLRSTLLAPVEITIPDSSGASWSLTGNIHANTGAA